MLSDGPFVPLTAAEQGSLFGGLRPDGYFTFIGIVFVGDQIHNSYVWDDCPAAEPTHG